MIEQHLHVNALGRSDGFLGEVTVTELITGDALASTIGLTAGTAQFSNEPWLHFVLEGVTLYVAKKTYRHSLSWNQINARGAVFGSRTIMVNGDTYKVRLLKGANSDPYVGVVGWDVSFTHGSEWNRLMYHITDNRFNRPLTSEGITKGDWARYSDIELCVRDGNSGNGYYTVSQETDASDTRYRLYNGAGGVSGTARYAATTTAAFSGWRPVLELVE